MAAAKDRPAGYRALWQSKPVLRKIYNDLYGQIAERLRPGRTLEVGGGSGNLKAFAPEVYSSDILPTSWLDVACDAQRLPFASNCMDNIVMMDVLHHIERPVQFLQEATRVLRPGGRILFCEPAITPTSWPVYHWCHPEPVRLSEDPFAAGTLTPGRDPYASNQAIPTLMFMRRKGRANLASALPGLRLAERRYLSLWAYPLSGGFRRWRLLPNWAPAPLLAVERALLPVLGPLCAFRMLVVLEKSPAA